MKHYFSNELIFILLALSVWLFLPIGIELYNRTYHPTNLIDEVKVVELNSDSMNNIQISTNERMQHSKSNKAVVRLNLNTCDTTALKQLNGIGSVLANRIVKFRSYLKGYVRVEQLKEVYGMSKENYEKLKHSFYVEEQALKVICKDTLLSNPYHYSHPYLSKELKQLITSKRKKNPFTMDSLDLVLKQNAHPHFSAYCY